jgi:hypothetical protein
VNLAIEIGGSIQGNQNGRHQTEAVSAPRTAQSFGCVLCHRTSAGLDRALTPIRARPAQCPDHSTEVPTKTKENAMDMRQYSSTTFIGVEEIRRGPRQEKIASVAPGKYDKPVATFESGDQLTLNRTNVRTLIEAFGEESGDWVGCIIELSIGAAKYNGDQIDSVVVKPVSPPRPLATQTPAPKAPRLDDDIPF